MKKEKNPVVIDSQTQEKIDGRIQEIEVKEFRDWCLKQYSDVFKEKLEPQDVIKSERDLQIHVDHRQSVRPVNITVPAEVPIHLQKAAKKELEKILAADILKPCSHPTDWCLRGFFVKKPHVREGDEMKVRLVSDFRPLNKILCWPGHPNESSSHLLKRLDPDSKYFAALDLTSGYHQIYLPEKYRDLFCIVLPSGKYRYKRLPQGVSPATDLFNLVTDKDLRELSWLYTNLDDILAVAPDFKTIKDRIIQILNVCRKRNIKLSPTKFQLGKKVTFGGVSVSHSSLLDAVCLDVTSDKVAEIEALRMPGTRREAQSFVGMICQLNQFIPNISNKLKHMRKLTSTSHTSFRPPPEAIMEFNSLKEELKK